MKTTNLLSLIQAYKNLDKPLCKKYFEYLSVNPKEQELKGIECLIEETQLINDDINLYDKYFLGYEIPQINGEFDLLRFGKDYIVNIELKSTHTEKIKKQLSKNKYYLESLGKEIFNFTFVSDEKKLYEIDNRNDLVEVQLTEIIKILKSQVLEEIPDINSLFNPSNYLVSPFNSTDKFIQDEYFLTEQQELFKKEALNNIKENGTYFVSICGKAGTGKTLLIYDIAKECIIQDMRVLIIHCGRLNEGHNTLIKNETWNIIPAKRIGFENYSNYDLVIIDEAQRIRIYQLDLIINQVKTHKSNCIFSYDMNQCLTKQEIDNNVSEYISKNINFKTFNLTNKIRTNKEIIHFTTGLFNKEKFISKIEISNIEINYFENIENAVSFIKTLSTSGWKVINYTPSTVHKHPYEKFSLSEENNIHDVIGQEFENVVAVIDSYFYYKDTGKLSTKGYSDKPYYLTTQMLYQIITRARKKLNLIIVNNKEVMERCLSILEPNLKEVPSVGGNKKHI